jgi:hypothetical protein
MKTLPENNACATSRHATGILLLCAVLFPALTGAVGGATAYPGYTFFASGSKAYLYDMSGRSVHTWTASGSAQTCAYLLADGSALFPIQNTSCTSPQHNGAYPNGRFQKISWDGTILWDYYFCDSTARAGYDVEPMPNGNILIPGDSSTVAKIFEVKPTGTTTGQVVWSNTLPSSITSGQTYINSVSYNPELDKILVDLQDPQRKLVVIDHSGSGAVTLVYTVASSGRIHAAAWVTKYFLGTTNVLPDADFAAMRTNNLLVVYNGGDKAVEVSLATNQVRAYSYAFDDHEGSVQRLPNGNTLVTKGNSTTITELDDSGTTVGTMTAPGSIQRAYRYGYAFSGVSRLMGSKTLTVVSPHDSPIPAGTTTNVNGTVITGRADQYETHAGSVQYENRGWTLAGGAATNGAMSGTTTNVTLTLTNNTTLTWLWKTNYWLATATNGGGALSFSGGAPGWNASTTSVTIAAAANPNWHFAAWSGDTSGCAIASAQITAPMTQVRTIAGTFAITPGTLKLSIAGNATNTGLIWLGATNLPVGATGSWLRATSLADANWQAGTPFVMTTTATNCSVPATSSNAFYRLRME